MPPLFTATPDQIARVIEVLSELHRCLDLSGLRVSFIRSHPEADAILEMECTDFVHLLSVPDARCWKFRWKESLARGKKTSYRRGSVQALCSVPPL